MAVFLLVLLLLAIAITRTARSPSPETIAKARRAAALAIAVGGDIPEASRQLRRLSVRDRYGIIQHVSAGILPESRTVLLDLLRLSGLEAAGDRWARSCRPWLRLRAVRILALADREDPRLGRLVDDPSRAVSTAALELAPPKPDPLVAGSAARILADSQGTRWFVAQEALRRSADPDTLAALLLDASGGTVERLIEVASATATPGPLLAAITIAEDAEPS